MGDPCDFGSAASTFLMSSACKWSGIGSRRPCAPMTGHHDLGADRPDGDAMAMGTAWSSRASQSRTTIALCATSRTVAR